MSLTLTRIIEKHGSRANNLDFIRLIAAILVVFSHSYNIAYGKPAWEQYEPLAVLTGGQECLGKVSVFCFFVLSGFLITASYQKSKSLLDYLWKRVIRIFPGLLVVLLLTALVLGPVLSTLSAGEYFSKPAVYGYIVNNLSFLKNQDVLPGVFTTNTLPDYVNGSLWTLKHEFYCYLTVPLLGMIGALKPKRMLAILVITLGFNYLLVFQLLPGPNWDVGAAFRLQQFMGLYSYFAAGMMVYLIRDRILINNKLACLSLGAVAFSIVLPTFIPLIFTIFGTYLFFYLGYAPWIKMPKLHKVGDLSYGIYIYGWPIQQVIALALGVYSAWWNNFLISMPLIALMALFSWTVVEKPALRFKSLNWKPVSPKIAPLKAE